MFPNSQNFLRQNACEIKNFSSINFVDKIEKLKLSGSKPHNKMLKLRSEMLKIRKIRQNNQAREKIPGISQIPRIFEIMGIFRPGNFLKIL